MKKMQFLFVIIIPFIFGCSEVNDNQLPALPDPDNVCSGMNDINFMAYCYDNFDVNHDGKVSIIEAKAVTTIAVRSQSIKSIKGIEYFSNLTSINCSLNRITELNLAGLPSLTSLSCWSNLLTTLDVSKCSSLTSLNCTENSNLTEIWLKSGQSILIFKDDKAIIKYK